MVPTDFANFSLMKSRCRPNKQMIIQQGPLLFDLESLQHGRELTINIKKIQLEHRPESSSSLTQRRKFLSSPKYKVWPYGNNGITPNPKTKTFYQIYKAHESPFQNEALKFPFNKRCYSSIKRIKRY